MKFSNLGLVLVSAILLAPVFAAPKTLTHYDQLVAALRQGDNVHAVFELDKCKLLTRGAAPALDMTGAMGRLNFDVFSFYKVLMPDGSQQYAVATSSSLLTEHRQFGPVQGYARLRVFADDSAELHFAHFDAKTYEQKTNINYVCQLNNGMTLFDATL